MMTVRSGDGPHSRRIDAYRRALDISISLALLLIALPIIVVIASGSALTLRAWPFFVQDRVGRDGRLFRFLKVRTLPVSVPGYVDKHQLDLGRIPAFCRLLRRLHLDELPQLLLVLRGRMSLVGPRPEMAHLHEAMPSDFASLRTSVRPGCTGLWQVSSACTGLISEAPEFDRTYLDRRTLRLDLWVLAHTTRKMLGFGRAVSLFDIPAWVGQPDHLVTVITLPETPGVEQLSLPLVVSP